MPMWMLHAIRVRYQETDRMGVVFHTNYLNWFEIGRTEWVRHAGFTYKDMEERGLLLPVIDIEASFRQPAAYDDWVTVCTKATEVSGVRVRFASRIVAGDQTLTHGAHADVDEPPGRLLVRGGTSHIWVNRGWQPVRLQREAPDWYERLRELAAIGSEDKIGRD